MLSVIKLEKLLKKFRSDPEEPLNKLPFKEIDKISV